MREESADVREPATLEKLKDRNTDWKPWAAARSKPREGFVDTSLDRKSEPLM